MPELPEVETVRCTLLPLVNGKQISNLEVLFAPVVGNTSVPGLRACLQGATICGIERRGKYLAFCLDNAGFLVVHLRMTGRLFVSGRNSPPEKHLRAIVVLSDHTAIRFVDQRKFGRLYWAKNASELADIARVGIEPLSEEFTPEAFRGMLQKSNALIKAFLLDQRRIAGLGNIYVDESLFKAGIHPARKASSLSGAEAESLWAGIRSSLADAIEHRGTTFRDYVDGEGNLGENQFYLHAYGRAGSPCDNCGQELQRVRVAGRGSVYCPDCQRPPEDQSS